MNKKIKTEAVDSLFDAILSLETREECYSFFEDLCTVNELLSLSQRFEVAAMLKDHKTYLDIAEKTGASTATISRVNRSLNYGNDGYDLVFKRIGKKAKAHLNPDIFRRRDVLLHYISLASFTKALNSPSQMLSAPPPCWQPPPLLRLPQSLPWQTSCLHEQPCFLPVCQVLSDSYHICLGKQHVHQSLSHW